MARALSTSPAPDVIVVGNGAVASSTALALLELDERVRVALVTDRARPACASAAAGAMHGCFAEIAAGALDSAIGREKLALAVEARRLWPSWLEGVRDRASLASDAVASRAGTWVVEPAGAGAGEARTFEAIAAAAAQAGEPVELADEAVARELVARGFVAPRRALYLPHEGSLDAALLLAALDAALARSDRVALVAGRARRLVVDGGAVRGCELEDGRALSAPSLVVAAGFGAQALLDSAPEIARRVPPLFAGAGASVVGACREAAVEPVVRTANRTFGCALHVVARAGGAVYVGATNTVLESTGEAPLEARALVEAAARELHPALAALASAPPQWGARPLTSDALPLVGATSLAGLFVASGTYRDGLHLSPLLALDAARRALGLAPLVPARFAPERPRLVARDRDALLDEAVLQLDGAAARGDALALADRSPQGVRAALARRLDALELTSPPPLELWSILGVLGGDPAPAALARVRAHDAAWSEP